MSVNNRAQAETIVILVSVSFMAIVGWIAMSLLSGGLFNFPTKVMITMDDSFVAEAIADMMINNKKLMAYEGEGGKEPGVIEITSSGLPGVAIAHTEYQWRVNVADLIEEEDSWEVVSPGLTVDWNVAVVTSRHVTLVRTDRDDTGVTRNLGEFNLILYREKE